MKSGTGVTARIFGLFYGALAYVASIAALLYAVGFVGNMGVPKSIDSGQPEPFLPSLLVNAVLLGIFAIQHSGMAREGFKQWWSQYIPQPIERSTYVLFSSLTLFLLYWQWRPLPTVIWNLTTSGSRVATIALFVVGWLLVLLATLAIHQSDLLGIRQVWLRFQGRPYRDLGFRVPGPYKYVRHPIQVGFLIAFWATPTMTVGHLIFSLTVTGYILTAVTIFEEHDLSKKFGPRYESYKTQVGRFLPRGSYRERPPSRQDAR